MIAERPQVCQPDPTPPLTPLAVARFVRRMSQRALASRSGVSERTIVYLEQNHHKPRKETALAICRALEIDDPGLLFAASVPNEKTPRGLDGASSKIAVVAATDARSG